MNGEMAIAPALDFGPALPRGAALGALVRLLREAGIDSAQIDGRVLLCAALGIDHATLIRDSDCPLGSGAATLVSFAARRLQREPVSRIIGHREFWQARFQIAQGVLDPRPETEMLVEAVLAHAARYPRKNWRILDLGTGSGAILCSALQSLPGSSGVGVDISPAACAIARDNLAALGLESRGVIVCGDWAHALRGRFDVIVSNPPYVASGAIAYLEPEVRDHDPRLALDGGKDGLAAYRELIPALPGLIAPGGLIALELGAGQYAAVEALLRGRFGSAVEVALDLRGCRRVVLARGGTKAEA
ncbi:MAG TPA: peptide chain release factor N(5)-glutamine methyltransferase [Methylocella sp.]|nr:peptide chain release factor N(5)-glutamine methyltransferase [Methylocella sp.]